MTVKELKAELDCYDEDVDVVFEFDDDVRVDSWTEDRWGGKKVSIDAFLKPTFCDFDDCEEKKPSNADHIRAMSDEELAEWLKNIRYSWTCVPRNNGNRCADFKDDCNACWLDWLKQEAE